MPSHPIALSHRQYLRIATITQPLLGAVDTAVVGRLESPSYIGGVAVGAVIMNTIYWLFGFFRVSTTSHSAMALGSGAERRTRPPASSAPSAWQAGWGWVSSCCRERSGLPSSPS